MLNQICEPDYVTELTHYFLAHLLHSRQLYLFTAVKQSPVLPVFFNVFWKDFYFIYRINLFF